MVDIKYWQNLKLSRTSSPFDAFCVGLALLVVVGDRLEVHLDLVLGGLP